MGKLVLNYENCNDFHPIIQAALLHGELVKIHPFIDGNGRTSRLLMNLDLMNHGYNPVIIKKEDRLEYYEALDKAHTTGDYTDFVKLITKLEIVILRKYLELGEKGLENKKKPGNPLAKYCNKKNLTDMEKLEYENMKLRIENERLKKGYSVKGVGQRKEYVIINKKNSK